MRRLRRSRRTWAWRTCATLATIVAFGILSSPGSSATSITIGRAAADPSTTCSGLLVFNVLTTFGGPTYYVPPGNWRLTSYSIHGGTSGGVGTLVVLRPQVTLENAIVIYSGAPQTLAAGTVNTFPANAVVSGGDIVALWMESGECGVFTGSSDDLFAFDFSYPDAPPETGSTVTPFPFAQFAFQINIAAQLTPIGAPPPPPRAAVCTTKPVVRGDGSIGYFADVLLTQLDTTDESSPYFGAQPAIFVEGLGLMCQISEVVNYGRSPAQFQNTGIKVDGTGHPAPEGLAAVWVAPYPYWARTAP